MSPSPRASLLPQVGGDGSDRKGKNTASPVMLLADGSSGPLGHGVCLNPDHFWRVLDNPWSALSSVCWVYKKMQVSCRQRWRGRARNWPEARTCMSARAPRLQPRSGLQPAPRKKKKRWWCRLVTAGPGNITVWSVLISGFSCVPPGGAFLDSFLLKLLFCGSEWSNTSSGVASEHYKFQRAFFCGHWVEWLLQFVSFLG